MERPVAGRRYKIIRCRDNANCGPGTFMHVYLSIVAGAASTNGTRSAWLWGLLIVGLAATIIVTVFITRLARQKLDAKTQLREIAAVAEVSNPC